MKFNRETFSLELAQEMAPLFGAHHAEVAPHEDIALNPDLLIYHQLSIANALRIFTVRDRGELVGYAVFIVRDNPHSMGSVQATQDILYLKPEMRGQGIGKSFIDWCDAVMGIEGVKTVFHHVTAKLDFGPLLESLGYRKAETVYTRRLHG